jgi:hypothetical protein
MQSSPRSDRLANLEFKIEEKEEKGVKEKDGLKIIRFDLCLASNVPIDAPKELWMDHAIVQETASSYQDDMVEHLEWRSDLQISCLPENRTDEREKVSTSPACSKTSGEPPSTRFQAVLSIPCDFLPWMQPKKWSSVRTIFNNHLKLDGPRSDGIPLGVINNRYNTQITNAICFGLLRGKALAMNSQGFTGVSRA